MSTLLGNVASTEQISITSANTARLLNKLRRGLEDASILNVGDSTGNGSDEHFYFEAQYLGTQFPAYTVVFHRWDESGGAAYDQSNESVLIIQVGATSAHAGSGTTSGSPTVTDSAIAVTDQGHLVTGPGVPANTYVGTVTAGASYLLSSSPTSQINVNATATATVSLTVSSLMLNVWNCSVSGMSTDYALGARYTVAILPTTPDLVQVSHGHNTGYSWPVTDALRAGWRGGMMALTEQVTHDFPLAGVVLHLQNPELLNNYQMYRAKVYEELAAARGFGIVNAQQAFLDLGANLSSYIKSDQIHPTNSADSPGPNGLTGSQIWANETIKALFAKASSPAGRSQQASFFEQTMPQLLTNGEFTAWASATPDGWALSGATMAKDSRPGYFESSNGYSARIQATGAAASSVSYDIPSPSTYSGKDICIAVRLRVASSQSSTAGRVAIQDSAAISVAASSTQARDGFYWVIVPWKVATNNALLRVRIYADSSANSGADINVDKVWVVRGPWPKRATTGAVGPAGPTGSASVTQKNYLSTMGTEPGPAQFGTSGTASFQAANQGSFCRVKPPRDISITSLIWVSGTASGNYDIGIYDTSGNRLWSKGTSATPAAGVVTETVSPAVNITAGTEFIIAITFDNTTASFRGIASGFAAMLNYLDGTPSAYLLGSVLPLPATVAFGSAQASRIPFIAVRG